MTTVPDTIPDTVESLTPPRGEARVAKMLSMIGSAWGKDETVEVSAGLAAIWHTLRRMDSAEKVAKFLADMGVRGDRHLHESCPLASLFGREAPGVEVDEDAVYFVCGDGRSVRLLCTPAMRQFILRFDAGEWPELVR